MRLIDRIHARLAGLSRKPARFASLPEPRGAGSFERGQALLAGRLAFAGEAHQVAPGSAPFALAAASPAFEAEAQAFGWLADLATYGTQAAAETARNWLRDWQSRFGGGRGPGWRADLAGRRTLHLIDNALFLLGSEASPEEPAFCRLIAMHLELLERRWHSAPAGLPRLQALAGLIRAAAVLEGAESRLPAAAKALGAEADHLIDRSGGLASRNPEELLTVFALLARMQQVLTEADLSPSPQHHAVLARTAPVLRALRHADGRLARFHGGGEGEDGLLDQALAAAGIRGPAEPGLAMGFCRISHGRSTLIIDAAAPPSGPGSELAQASTLGMELTSGRRPVVVSSGPGQWFGPDWYQAGRATASASTLEILNVSSSRLGLDRAGALTKLLAEVPGDIRSQITSDETGTEAVTSHDGYVATHGLTHMRRLSLTSDGRALLGEDTLAAVKAEHQRLFDDAMRSAPQGIDFAIRFHLHPEVEAVLEPGGASVLLRLVSGEVWSFRHDGVARLSLEPSAWLSPESPKPLANKQVVLSAAAIDYASRVRWSLAKTPDMPLATRDLTRGRAAWMEQADG